MIILPKREVLSDTRPPKCSVIVPTFNRRTLLRHTLDSLTLQDVPFETFEVIVVDDGSTDDSHKEIEQFKDRLRIRYIFQEDRGFRVAAARNKGILAARGKLCVFVDAGVVLHSSFLRAHWNEHQRSRKPAGVIGLVYCFSNRDFLNSKMLGDIDLRRLDDTIAYFRKEGRWSDVRLFLYEAEGTNLSHLPAAWTAFWTCNVSVPTVKAKEAGLFDEHFRSWGGEDIEFAYRLTLIGCEIRVCTEAEAIHFPHGKAASDNFKSGNENSLYIGSKHDTPISRLFSEFQDIENVNAIARSKNLPRCADETKRRSLTGFVPNSSRRSAHGAEGL
jgi:glycosyltransferase involved in cell wall biosynthesis